MNNENLTYTIGVIGFDRSERCAQRHVVGMAESALDGIQWLTTACA